MSGELPTAAGHLYGAAENMDNAAGACAEAGRKADEMAGGVGNVQEALEAAGGLLSGVIAMRGEVAGYMERSQQEAALASGAVAQASGGGGQLGARIGDFGLKTFTESPMQGSTDAGEKFHLEIIALADRLGELSGAYIAEATRQSNDRSPNAANIAEELRDAANAAATIPGM